MGGDASVIAQLAAAFGPTGLIIGYLIWRETRFIDKQIEATNKLAAALAALTVCITGRSDPDV